MPYEVTIGIPVYRAVKYVSNTLLSALNQDFDNLEILIIDDCGDDGSIEVIRKIKEEHPKGNIIRVVRQPQNMGIGKARNRIIDEAQGRFLFFLDADDILPQEAIRIMYEAAISYQAQIVYGSSERIIDFGSKQRVEKESYESMVFLNNNDFADYAYSRYGNIPANVWKFLININIYRDNHLYFPDINFWEDFTMTIDLPTYIERAVFLPNITYHYYSRYGTLSNNQQRKCIDKDEIVKIAAAIGGLKTGNDRLKYKPYYLKRCLKVMMTEFYMVCYILKHRDIIKPKFSNKELRDMMRSPLTVGEVVGLDSWKLKNMVMYLLGVIPSFFSVSAIWMIGKMKHLI